MDRFVLENMMARDARAQRREDQPGRPATPQYATAGAQYN
jgi:hypothetical protein